MASQIGDKHEQADQARDHWRRALACYTDLGLPESEDVRAELTALGNAALPSLAGVGLAIPAHVRARTG